MKETQHMIRNVRFENLEPNLPLLEDVSRFYGEWRRDIMLEPVAIERLRRTAIASSAGASTRIEGASLNDKQSLEVILKGKKLYEERSAEEVLGYSEALKLALSPVPGRQEIITQKTIKNLHAKQMKYCGDGLPGRYRYTEVNVTDGLGGILLVCALPDLIPGFMLNAVKNLNQDWKRPDKSKLAAIAVFIAEFLAIHPFEDGNGRCARLLTVMLLKRAGHDYLEFTSLESHIEKHKVQYYITLNKFQKTGVLDNWFRFFLMTLRETQLSLKNLLKHKEPGQSKTAPSLRLEIRKAFESKPSFTAGEIVALTGKSPAGVRKALNQLVENGELKASGKNRGRFYSLPARRMKV